ncbi:hypothetical protein VPH35_069789 [Triticum aestivum]|uniref:uncharacterized protein n=1 Tax=Triticum aestivum TaxID=4565 RepID=UPI0003D54D5D|nr:uncharacterized protein LOC123088313 [Triticum aestivum]
MAGKEEVEAARRWMMSPCTAAKSTDGAAAGDDGPVMRFPSKRKAASGSIYKVGEPLPANGWIHPAGEGDLSALHRREAAIDKMLQESKLPATVKQGTDANAAVKQSADTSAVVKQGVYSSAAAACGSKGKKYRLKKSELRTIIALRPEPYPPADDYLELAPFFPPGWLEQKKREEEEDAVQFARMEAEFEAFRQQVIEGVKKNGYFEVDEDPSDGREREEANEYARQEMAEIDFSELRLLDARPNLPQAKFFPYVPNEDDALLDDIPSDDDDFEEEDALPIQGEDFEGEAAAAAHKLVPPIQSS